MDMENQKTLTSKEEKYNKGSAFFVEKAKNGELEALVNYVYFQEDPYINYAKNPSRLARNAISFFIIHDRKKAIKGFFNSPFVKDLQHEEWLDILNTVINKDDIEIWKIIKEVSSFNMVSEDMENLLNKACKDCSDNMILELVEKKKEISQTEKMNYFLAVLENKDHAKALRTFQLLETVFTDLLYHQNDDVLMRTAAKNKNQEVMQYLMYDKKLRITKHLNDLSRGDRNFSEIVEKRKIYDSLNQKSINQQERLKNQPKEEVKKLKI